MESGDWTIAVVFGDRFDASALKLQRDETRSANKNLTPPRRLSQPRYISPKTHAMPHQRFYSAITFSIDFNLCGLIGPMAQSRSLPRRDIHLEWPI
jgi:hypothetical protein